MKRFGNLYHKIYAIENIREAHDNAKRRKGHYREVKMVEADPEKYFFKIHDMLKNKTFENSAYTIFQKTDQGKHRTIFKLPYFPDRIVHHCIVQVLELIWMKTLISDTWASMKKRGIHKGVYRIKAALKDIGNTRHCLKFDIRQFYPSINHEILKRVLAGKIKDPDVMWLLGKIIDSSNGVPIGNYLSQFFGNLYLSPFDHWMKEENRCRYYFRYCDDMVVLSKDKAWLHALRKQSKEYLASKLKLEIKGNWQVFPVDSRGIDFLGYRFFHGYTLLRKSTAKQFKKRIRHIQKNWRKMRAAAVVNSVMSYWGWMKHANCLNLSKAFIDDEIKEIISTVCAKEQMKNPLLSIAEL